MKIKALLIVLIAAFSISAITDSASCKLKLEADKGDLSETLIKNKGFKSHMQGIYCSENYGQQKLTISSFKILNINETDGLYYYQAKRHMEAKSFDNKKEKCALFIKHGENIVIGKKDVELVFKRFKNDLEPEDYAAQLKVVQQGYIEID